MAGEIPATSLFGVRRFPFCGSCANTAAAPARSLLPRPVPAHPLMQTEIKELHRTRIPRPAIYVTAMSCGMLMAMAIQIMLARSGIELAMAWRSLLTGEALQARSAGAWWLMAGTAFLTGAIVAGALSRLPLPWRRLRLVRWVLGAAIVSALAAAGHVAALAPDQSVAGHVAASLAALVAAALVAQFGAYFSVKR